MLQQTNAQYQQANRELESKSFFMDVYVLTYYCSEPRRDQQAAEGGAGPLGPAAEEQEVVIHSQMWTWPSVQ